MSNPIRKWALSLVSMALALCPLNARAIDTATAEKKLNDLSAHFSEIDLSSNESRAAVDFFKSGGEAGYAFLHHAYSGGADGMHQKAALYIIFQAFPEHKHLYLNQPIRAAYGDDYGYSYCSLKPYLAKLDAYTMLRTPHAEDGKVTSALESAVMAHAKQGAAGVESIKKLLTEAVAKDKADKKAADAPELLAVLEALRTHGSASLLDAPAAFLNDERPAVARAAMSVFQTHAAQLGAKLGSNQECFVWWAIEGKQRVQVK